MFCKASGAPETEREAGQRKGYRLMRRDGGCCGVERCLGATATAIPQTFAACRSVTITCNRQSSIRHSIHPSIPSSFHPAAYVDMSSDRHVNGETDQCSAPPADAPRKPLRLRNHANGVTSYDSLHKSAPQVSPIKKKH